MVTATARSTSFRWQVSLLSVLALVLATAPAMDAAADDGARDTSNICDDVDPGDFDDIDDTTHEDNIRCLAAYGLTEGVDDGEFDPNGEVTRAQMAAFIVRFVEEYTGEELPVGDDHFDDVSEDSTHFEAIHKLREAGITVGTADSDGESFEPSASMSRGQMSSFISRAMSFVADGQAMPEHEPPRTDESFFTDIEGSVHADNINALAAAGIVEGYEDGSFGQQDPVLRGQIASFIMRGFSWAVEVEIGEPDDEEEDPTPTPTPDPDPDDPTAEDVDPSDSILSSSQIEHGVGVIVADLADGEQLVEGLEAEDFSFDIAVAVAPAEDGPRIEGAFQGYGSENDHTSDNLIVITDVPVEVGLELPAYITDDDAFYSDELKGDLDLIDDQDEFESDVLSNNEVSYDEIADYLDNSGHFEHVNLITGFDASFPYIIEFSNDDAPIDDGYPALLTSLVVGGNELLPDAGHASGPVFNDDEPVLPVPIFLTGLIDAESSGLDATGEDTAGDGTVVADVHTSGGSSVSNAPWDSFSFDIAVAVAPASGGPTIEGAFQPYDDEGDVDTNDNLIVITDVPVEVGLELPAYITDDDAFYSDELKGDLNLINGQDEFESDVLSNNEVSYDEIADYLDSSGEFENVNELSGRSRDFSEYTFTLWNDDEPIDAGYPALITGLTVAGEEFIPDADGPLDGDFAGSPDPVLAVPVFVSAFDQGD